MRALILVSLAAALAMASLIAPADLTHADAQCETDEECMRHCPPPNDDPDCDGGPQS